MSRKSPPAATPDTDVTDDVTIEASSGNVFEDLGLPNAEERLAKALLARAIRQIIAARGWTQARAAKAAGIAASDMSDIIRGKLAKFSLDRLDSIILDLGVDIEMRLTPARTASRRGRVSVKLVATS